MFELLFSILIGVGLVDSRTTVEHSFRSVDEPFRPLQ